MNPDFAGRVNVPSFTTYGTAGMAGPTDPPTLTIRAVRCVSKNCSEGKTRTRNADGQWVWADCPTCHARGPEPGWVWPDTTLELVATNAFADVPLSTAKFGAKLFLNALYAAQPRIG